MPSLLNRYATPFTTGLFLISLVSGIALFVHVGSNYFRAMHEWLSMVLIVPFVLHLWRNWHAMTVYFSKPAFAIAMVASLVMAFAFVFQAGSGRGGAGGRPQFALVEAILSHSPAEVAAALGTTPEALVAQLQAKGFTAAELALPLKEIGEKSGKDDFDLTSALLPPI